MGVHVPSVSVRGRTCMRAGIKVRNKKGIYNMRIIETITSAAALLSTNYGRISDYKDGGVGPLGGIIFFVVIVLAAAIYGKIEDISKKK